MARKIKSIAETRAANNVARLFSGELSGEQAGHVNGWLQGDKEYQAEFLADMHLLADMDDLKNDDEVISWGNMPNRSTNSRGTVIKSVMSVAAVLVVTAGLFLFQGETETQSEVNRYASGIGEIKTINLDDGSEVTLNSGTKLLVSFTDAERHIILERGEAFFDVVRDQSRPFNVVAGAREVTVLGTAFSVRKQPDNLVIAVTEGAICIHREDDEVFVGAPTLANIAVAGEDVEELEQFRVEAGWVAEIATAEKQLKGYQLSSVLLSWRDGYLEFSRMPLYKVVQELNRYSGKKVLIEDPEIIGLEVSAVIRIDRIGQALRDLENTIPVKVVSHFDRVVLTGK